MTNIKDNQKLETAEELEVKCQEYLAGWQRSRADYENLQKETAKKTKDLGDFVKARLLLEVLPIYDDYKLTLEHLPQEHCSTDWAKGFFHIKKEFEQFFKNLEIKEIKTIGEQFNPELHEALASEASDQPENQIIKEIKAGYQAKDGVIRPSQVIVSAGQSGKS